MLELVLRLAPGLCLLVRYFDANFDHPKATKDATRIATVQQVLRRAWLIPVVNVNIRRVGCNGFHNRQPSPELEDLERY